MKQASIKNLSFYPVNVPQAPVLRGVCVNGENTTVCSYLCLANLIVNRLVLLLLCFPLAALAASSLDNSAVLSLSTYDQSVVIELPGADMQALSVGQSLEGIDAVLIDVLENRAVFEEIVVNNDGAMVKETVWIYKAVNGVSLVQRLSRQAPAAPVHEVTRVISSESKADTAATK